MAAKKNHIARRKLRLCAAIWALGMLVSSAAYAQISPAFDLNSCAGSGFLPSDFTAKVVKCLQSAIQGGVDNSMAVLSDYLQPTVSAMFAVALIIFGLRVAAGEQELKTKATGFLFRIGLVWIFCYELNNWSSNLFSIMQELTSLVPGANACPAGSTPWPWCQVDYFLGILMGFAPGLLFAQGMLGLLFPALLSGTAGTLLFASGIAAFFNLLWFIFEIVYTYLAAVAVLGFLILVSPILIPLALFHHTEKYFKKWLDILIAALITPMIMFAFLSIALNLITKCVGTIMRALGVPCPATTDNLTQLMQCQVPDFSPIWQTNNPFFSWKMLSDRNFDDLVVQVDNGLNGQPLLDIPAQQPGLNPLGGFNLGSMTLPGIYFGPNQESVIGQIIMAFGSLWVLIMILKPLLQQIIVLADSIAGASPHIPFRTESFKETVQGSVRTAAIGGGAAAGAAAGGELGAMGGSAVGRQAGGMLGGLAGAMVASRVDITNFARLAPNNEAAAAPLELNQQVTVRLPTGQQGATVAGVSQVGGVTVYDIRLENGQVISRVNRSMLIG